MLTINKTSSLLEELKTSNGFKNLAIILGVFLVIIIFCLIFVPWQQTVSVTGRVVAYAPLDRQQYIDAPIDGKITKWNVQEGAQVKKDEIILEISDNDPNILDRLSEEKLAIESRIFAIKARVASIKARITALSESMDNSVSGASSRTRMSKDRIIAAEHAVDAAEAVHKTALLNLKRQKNLASSGLASTRAVETAEMEEARALTDLNRAKSALSAAKSEQNALLSDQMRFGTDGRAAIADAKAAYAAAQAELSSAQADLPRIQVRLSRQHSQIVRAPRDGTIMRILVYENAQMLKSGEHLAILIPDTMDRAVELWVDGNDVPLVSEGRSTSIQFQGWPIFQFSGWPNLAYGTFHGKVFLVDSTDNGSGKFRVLVRPEGKDWPSGKYLRQGVRANGWIFLNQVSLGYELWRKFNDFPPTIPFDSSHNLDSHGSGKKSKNEKK